MSRDVVVAMVSDTWSDSVRRGFYSTADQTILSLLDSPDVGKVLVADHPRALVSQVKRRLSGDRPAPRSGRLRGVRPLVSTTAAPREWEPMLRRYRNYDRQLHLAARLHGLRDPAVVTFNLYHAAVGSDWASRTVFYVQDDEAAIPRLAPYEDLARRAYATVDLSTTSVVSVSRTLLQRVAPQRGGVVVTNGIDPVLWAHPVRVPAEAGRGPIAVYAGTVDARLDVPALAALASAGYVVRVFGGVADAAVGQALSAITGIHVEGSVDRTAVASLLASADVCVLAHRETPLTSAMSPLKLFEYLASGTPVVTTRLAGIRDDPTVLDHAVLVEPGGDFAAAADAARARGRLPEEVRRRVVEELSWRRRHRDLVSRIL